MATSWPDEVDRVIDGDLTAALAYVTPAGGELANGFLAKRGLKKACSTGALERLRETTG
jgi:hypothetical protein